MTSKVQKRKRPWPCQSRMAYGIDCKNQLYDPMSIFLPGLSRKPYLVTQQGTVLAPGENLTLKCFSETNYDRFALYKEGEHDLTQVFACQPRDGHFHTNFIVGSGNYFIGGRYRCLGAHSNSSEWSAPSDPLDILITGGEYSAFSWDPCWHRIIWDMNWDSEQ